MSSYLDSLARVIEETLDENGWNQPHLVAHVWHRSDQIQIAIVHAFRGPPIDEIPRLPGPPADVDAVLVATEAWTYPLDDTPTSFAELNRLTRTPSEHPGRVECRQVYIVDRHGNESAVMRRRGSPPVSTNDQGVVAVTGNVPLAARSLLARQEPA